MTTIVKDRFAGRVALVTGGGQGIGRAIVPAHLPGDGDLVFAASTGAKQLADPHMELGLIGHAAALCLSRAIARAVYLARPAPGDLLPCWSDG